MLGVFDVELTPFQPVGPYFHVMLRGEARGVASLVTGATRGERIVIGGAVLDGSGAPVTDALVEIWHADAEGRYPHPGDPSSALADPAFRGYGRVATGGEGRFEFRTIRPGPVPSATAGRDDVRGGPGPQAPHVLVALLAPGILTRYWTRIYFEDEPSNADDRVLKTVPSARRHTLLARPQSPGRYRFDLVIQGPGETVFFDA